MIISPIGFKHRKHTNTTMNIEPSKPNRFQNQPSIKERLKNMGSGFAVGATLGLFYFGFNKKYTGKRLIFNTLELASLFGLTTDMIGTIKHSASFITKHKKEDESYLHAMFKKIE